MQDNSCRSSGDAAPRLQSGRGVPAKNTPNKEEVAVKETWSKPQVTEQEVGLEVTSYVAAEIKDS